MAYCADLFNPNSLTTLTNIENAIEFEGVLTERNSEELHFCPRPFTRQTLDYRAGLIR
jgi:hypothetical protein